MGATFIGVRHHSPACARLVAATIESLHPAHVLIEGPADFNDRLDEQFGSTATNTGVSGFKTVERVGTHTRLTIGQCCQRFLDDTCFHRAAANRANRRSIVVHKHFASRVARHRTLRSDHCH